MNLHQNARLTAHRRAELVRRVLDHGQPRRVVAAAFGVDPKTVGKWVNRFRAEGAAGLADHWSRPHRLRVPRIGRHRVRLRDGAPGDADGAPPRHRGRIAVTSAALP